jgi:8-amino-7-oxononanoate synthase
MKEKLASDLEAICESGLWRELRTLDAMDGVHVRRAGRDLLNFSSNDYLGLAASTELKAALIEGVEKHGAGSGASRLVCGSHAPHEALEAEIAQFKRTEAALTFSSGYAVPLGVIPALVGKGDVIILDKLSHACLVDAARLSGATIRVFPHNHLEKLERLLRTTRETNADARVLVVTESVFSMDGDLAALAEITELKDRFGAWLMLDEAHAVGVLGPQGRGLAAALGLEQQVDLHMGTLSKAAGLSGGYLAASRQVIDLLVNRARSFIYSTAPPPALAHAAGVSLRFIQGDEGERRRERLRANLDSGTGLKAHATSGSAILPVIIGDETRAVRLSERLLEEGFLVPAIRYPTVARGSARLRITLSAAHEVSEIEALAVSLRGAMAELA